MKYIMRFFSTFLIPALLLLSCDGGSSSGSNASSAVIAAKNALNIEFAPGNSADFITRNIILPTKGEKNTTITWHSFDPHIITDEGIVYTPPFSVTQQEFNTVKLLATISKGEEKTYKFFSLVVRSHGIIKRFKIDTVSFKMALAPGPKTIPNSQFDENTITVNNAFWIGETEVTYELWYKVYTWATTDNGEGKRTDGGALYLFTFYYDSEPRAGKNGTPGEETDSQKPVVYPNWRHAMVWCNALTEYYNYLYNDSLQCVYTTDSSFQLPIRSATSLDSSGEPVIQGSENDPYVNHDAEGFRLLTSNEWSLAARYRGTDNTNTVQSIIETVDFENPADGIFWTTGMSPSGSTEQYGFVNFPFIDHENDTRVGFDKYAIFRDNSSGIIAEVKTKLPNSLNLYDMNGNVTEWVYDSFDPQMGIFNKYRLVRGGDLNSYAISILVGSSYNYPPWAWFSLSGFRFARNAK